MPQHCSIRFTKWYEQGEKAARLRWFRYSEDALTQVSTLTTWKDGWIMLKPKT